MAQAKLNSMHKWYVSESHDKASQAAADYIANLVSIRLIKKDSCHIALPGGNTPGQCLEYLAEKNLRWENCHWYLGDERCYEKGHEERNDVMLEKVFWSRIDKTNLHKIPAEKGAEQGASVYRSLIDASATLDIVFLGLGEDGHTASLFPGNPALDDPRSVVPVFNSPKPPSERVSLGVETLKKAGNRIILSTGSAKAEIIKRIRQGEDYPVNRIGSIDWFVDEQAFI